MPLPLVCSCAKPVHLDYSTGLSPHSLQPVHPFIEHGQIRVTASQPKEGAWPGHASIWATLPMTYAALLCDSLTDICPAVLGLLRTSTGQCPLFAAG